MLHISYTRQFKKDYKKLSRSGNRDIGILQAIIARLAHQEELEQKYRNHFLSGNWQGFQECHLAPDWLLIYKVNAESSELILVRTGSHSQLFE